MLTLQGLEEWYVQTVKLKHAFAGTTAPDPIPLPSVTNIDGLLEGLAGETEETLVAAAQYAGKYHGETNAYKIQLPAKIYRWYGMKKVGGRTIIFNQVSGMTSSTSTSSGVTFSWTAAGVLTTTGTATADLDKTKQTTFSFIQGHKYVLKGCPAGGSASTYSMSVNEGRDTGNGVLFTASSTGKRYIHYVVKSGTNVNGFVWNTQLFDLTVMFGAGNEPTLDEFKAMFPANYYAPSANTMMNAGVTAIVSKDADDSVVETITIPSAIKSLTGYGISCPGKYNYIDFEDKKFVQNVGSRAYASGDESDATVITDGTVTHYPLTTPVETDITIADDIAHADGGSITFEHPLGADYLVTVPVDVRYIG